MLLEMTDNELIFKKHWSSVEWAADHLGTEFISQDFFPTPPLPSFTLIKQQGTILVGIYQPAMHKEKLQARQYEERCRGVTVTTARTAL